MPTSNSGRRHARIFIASATLMGAVIAPSTPTTVAVAAPTTAASVPAAPVPSNRCGSKQYPWTFLPEKVFKKNTVVDAQCIKLPAKQITKIESGMTVIVIARRGFLIESDASIDARGSDGAPGSPGQEQIFPAGPPNAASQCLCSGDPAVNEKTCGKMGSAGTAAGNLTVVARGIEIGAVPNFVFDASGGLQGAQGKDSRIHCTQFIGSLDSAYGCCKNHPTRANAGDGKIAITIDGSDTTRDIFVKASRPTALGVVMTVASAWEAEAKKQLELAVKNSWDVKKGADTAP